MHTFRATAFLLVALSSVARTEELKADDVPTQCTAICGPMVALTNKCDINPDSTKRRMLRRQTGDDGGMDDESDEPIEAKCICTNTSFNVRKIAALCAACIAQNGAKTDDMNKIMSQCNFTSTTYSPAATTAVAGVTVVATKPTVTSAAGTKAGSNASTGPSSTSTAKASAAIASLDLGLARYGAALAGIMVVAILGY